MSDETEHGALPLTELPGSDRGITRNPHAASSPAPSGPIGATLVLRRRAPLDDDALSGGMTSSELAERHGADPADIREVTRVLGEQGVSVVSTDAASRRIRIEADVATMDRVFGTHLAWIASDDEHGQSADHWSRSGSLGVPAAFDGVVTAVLGLDDRRQARAHFVPAKAAATSYTPVELGAVYRFPSGTDGSGRTIAILELGGGFDDADLDAYFSSLGVGRPTVTAVGVDGAANVPGQDPQGADGEVLLDIEVAGALAPKADLVVYFAPNTDAGFLDALSEAAHADPAPDAISISWGQYEEAWTAQSRTAFDDALVDAAALGITVTAAAGDDGSTDRATDGTAHVDFPASSPHVLACGGTSLTADASGAVTREVVWNDGAGRGATGGGVSRFFAQPSWQAGVGVPARPASGVSASPSGTDARDDGHGGVAGSAVPEAAAGGRGVPDVSAVADPETGYRVRVDGVDTVIGGTSAVAPLWAALVARIVERTGSRLGLAQPALYRSASVGASPAGFRDITSGDNGAYAAAAGWDACTGLGVPDGEELASRLG